MYPEIEEEVIKQILLPKKEKVIMKMVDFLNNGAQRLVQNNVKITVVNFIHDLPFTFRYIILPDNSIIDNKFHTPAHLVLDYRDKNDSEIMGLIISNYSLEYENEGLDDDEIYDWVSTWESENKEVEYNFFSDCWIEAKKRTNSEMRALLYEHECWSNSYELDDKIFLDQENHLDYLKDKGISIKTYK